MTMNEFVKTVSLNSEFHYGFNEALTYLGMGLAEETGEVISEIRKYVYKGQYHEKELDRQHLEEELGDIIWYLAAISIITKTDIGAINKKAVHQKLLCSTNQEERVSNLKIGAMCLRKSSADMCELLEEYAITSQLQKEKLEQAMLSGLISVRQLGRTEGLRF